MRFIRIKSLSSTALSMGLSLGLLFSAPALAAEAETRSFDIPAADAASALKLFARQAGQTVIDTPDWARRITVNPVKGDYTPEQALARMLAGTELAATQEEAVVFEVERKPPPAQIAAAQALLPRVQDDAGGVVPSFPSVLISGEEFTRWGAVNAEELLNTLPQFVGGRTAFSNTDGDGTATADLRGLGAKRTLVLINGRRQAPSGLSQTVDLNTLPTFLIDSVNVTTGGAAYGADALAGAVDFRMRKVDGLELGGQYGVTGHGDGVRINAHVALGTDLAGGLGHLTLYGEYFDRKAITQDKRGFSSVPLVDRGDGLAGQLSSTTPGGRFVVAPNVLVPAGAGLGAIAVDRGAGTTFGSAMGASFSAPGTTSAEYTAADGYNPAAETYLQLPQRRWQFGASAEYAIHPAITAYGEVAFAENKVATQIAATEITGRFRVNTIANAKYWTAADQAAIALIDANEEKVRAAFMARGVPSDTTFTTNYYLPGANVAVLDMYRRFSEGGPRISVNDRRTFRTLAGLRGTLSPRWNYDAYFSYASTRNANTQRGGVSMARFMLAVEQGTINVYGPGSLTSDMVKSIAVTTQNREDISLAVGHAQIDGELFNLGLGAGDVTLTVGGEYRRMAGSYTPDALMLAGDVIGFTPRTATRGRYDVREAFGNIRLPILEERPFIRELRFDGGIRYSDYSLDAVDPLVTYSLAGIWAPDDQFSFHAQYERGARAPNPDELYGAGGNPSLQAEHAHTMLVGATFQPHSLPGLNLSLDHFNIEVRDMILQSGNPLVANTNLASQKTSGWDIQAGYAHDLAFGLLSDQSRIEVSLLGTYTTRNELRTGGASADVLDLAGAFGSGTVQAKRKWTSSLSWANGPLVTGLRWRHIGAAKDGDPSTTYLIERLNAYDLVDLSLSYDFAWQLRISAGVNNLANAKPSISGSNQDEANTFPGVYDVRGRDFFVSATAKF